jgi:hypothetical protein
MTTPAGDSLIDTFKKRTDYLLAQAKGLQEQVLAAQDGWTRRDRESARQHLHAIDLELERLCNDVNRYVMVWVPGSTEVK